MTQDGCKAPIFAVRKYPGMAKAIPQTFRDAPRKNPKVDEVTESERRGLSRSWNPPEKSQKTGMEFYWSRAVGIVCNMIREY
jgi:hypothetical protein